MGEKLQRPPVPTRPKRSALKRAQSADRLDRAIILLRRLDTRSRRVRPLVRVQRTVRAGKKVPINPRASRFLRRYKKFKTTVQILESGGVLPAQEAEKMERIDYVGQALPGGASISSYLLYSGAPLSRYAARVLKPGLARMVLGAVGDKVCMCTLSDGKRKRSWPSTQQACVAAASQYGLDWEWKCG